MISWVDTNEWPNLNTVSVMFILAVLSVSAVSKALLEISAVSLK